MGRVDPSGMMDDEIWVKTGDGKIVYNSAVKNQEDAEAYYGKNAKSLYCGYTFKNKNGEECRLMGNGIYIKDGIKIHAKDEAPCGVKIKNFIKRWDEGGHYDGANLGTVTKQDWEFGLAVVGTIVSAGAAIEAAVVKNWLGVVISGLGTVNSIDDACVNSEGVTFFELHLGGDNPVTIQIAKTVLDAANVACGIYYIKSIKPLEAISTATSTVSTVNDVKKINYSK